MGFKSAERTKSKPKIIRDKKKSWKALRFFALDDLSGFLLISGGQLCISWKA